MEINYIKKLELESIYGEPTRLRDGSYRVTIKAGTDIRIAINDAIIVARILIAMVVFDLNDVTIWVCASSDPNLIYRDWDRASIGCIDKEVGPFPNPTLTKEEQEQYDRIKAEIERESMELCEKGDE